MEPWLSDGKPRRNKRLPGKVKSRMVFLTGLGEATWHPLRGHLQRSKQGADRELGAGPEAHASLRFVDGVLWGSGAKAGLTYSNPKEQGLGTGRGSYLTRKRRRLWGQGRLLITGVVGSHIRKLLVTLGCSLACAQERGWCQVRIQQAAWPHKMDTKTAILWSSFPQLSTVTICACRLLWVGRF